MKYRTFADHVANPYHYRVRNGYHDIQKINGFEFQPLFDNWDIPYDIANKIIWVPNPELPRVFNQTLTDYLLGAPSDTVIVLVCPIDQLDYETELRPVLQFHKDYHSKHGHYKNQFAIDLTNNVSDRFKEEFKEVASFSHDPIFWLAIDVSVEFESKIKNVPFNTEKIISKHFLSLNNRASWDRQSLLYLIEKFNLQDKFHFSYRCQNSSRNGYISEFDKLHQLIGDAWYNQGLDTSSIKARLPLVLDTLNYSREKNISPEYYNSSFCSVIMETFQRPSDPINTEKIIKTIAHGHPFLLYGSDGHLKFLRDLGFETFSDVFDESYDLIADPVLRLEAMFREILRISSWSLEECSNTLKKIKSKLLHNRNRLFEIKENSPQIFKAHTDWANYDYRAAYQRLARRS